MLLYSLRIRIDVDATALHIIIIRALTREISYDITHPLIQPTLTHISYDEACACVYVRVYIYFNMVRLDCCRKQKETRLSPGSRAAAAFPRSFMIDCFPSKILYSCSTHDCSMVVHTYNIHAVFENGAERVAIARRLRLWRSWWVRG